MLNPKIILAYLGAHSISDMLSAIVYAYNGDTPLLFGNIVSSIGFFIMLHLYVNHLEKNKEKDHS